MRFVASLIVAALGACGSVQGEEIVVDGAPQLDSPVQDGMPADEAPPIDMMIDAPPEVPLGPKLWLKFNDNPGDGVLDSAATPHQASCQSCPTLVSSGHKGNAYQFTSDRIDVLNSDLNPGGRFTVSAWIRLDESAIENSVAVCEQVGANCTYGLMGAVGDHPGWYSDGPSQTTGSANMAIGTWYHTMMIWDGANRITYFNGTMVDTQPVSAMSQASTTMTIGARNFSSALYFKGSIDEVLFYDRVLNAAEIALVSQP